MKKLLSALLSATLLASFAVMPVSADKTDVTYGSWKTLANSNNGGTATVGLVTTSDVGVDGVTIDGHAIKLTVDKTVDNTNVCVYQDSIKTYNGKTYRLSGKMYCSRGSEHASLLNDMTNNSANRIDELYDVIGWKKNADGQFEENPGWTTFKYEFTAKNDAARLAFGLSGSGTIVLDDLSLVEVTEENGVTRYSEEMFADGDFESTFATAPAAGKFTLSGVTGWTESNWNIPTVTGNAPNAGIDVLENIAGTPEGNHMLKLWTTNSTSTNLSSHNANATQHITNLDTAKTYRLTGWVNSSANVTYAYLGNTDASGFNSNSGMELRGHFGGADKNDGKWNKLSVDFKPTNATVELRFTAGSRRTMYIDDLAVREVETVEGVERLGENLLVNGGFEDDYAIYETGNHTLSGVPGWTRSNWNIANNKYPAGVTLLENLVGAPKGGNVLKVWAGGTTNLGGHNAHAIQILNGLDKTKTYRLTGSVKHSSNNTAIYLGNTNFNEGKEKQLREYFGGEDSDRQWNDLSIDFMPNDSNNIELRFTASANRSIWLNGLSVKEVLSDGTLGDVEYLKNGSFTAATVSNPVLKAETVFYPAQQENNGYSIMDNTELEALSGLSDYETDSICAFTTVENTTEVAEKVYTYLAIYSGDVLQSVVVGNTTVESSENKVEISTYYTLPTDKTGLALKLFAWDASMKPLGVNGEIK